MRHTQRHLYESFRNSANQALVYKTQKQNPPRGSQRQIHLSLQELGRSGRLPASQQPKVGYKGRHFSAVTLVFLPTGVFS